ncbi:hypothetical protein H6P81_012353 [Aristolochia fimbriata]|uniref:Protein NEOXANTHIN-DEFICIENT 1 n=1 Tax=Aristolochia fimbriata TaxID=158543 RepID=A0AAV7EBK8_ARIFI|nr:hypothetical protein H6P81_012353 [Aristolochia fimbriata]
MNGHENAGMLSFLVARPSGEYEFGGGWGQRGKRDGLRGQGVDQLEIGVGGGAAAVNDEPTAGGAVDVSEGRGREGEGAEAGDVEEAAAVVVIITLRVFRDDEPRELGGGITSTRCLSAPSTLRSKENILPRPALCVPLFCNFFSRSNRVMENESSSGYANGPPWLFRGRALYQLHLVKAKTARAFIPKELKLVEAFGYTLGGFFLAHYDESPAGMFDELVVIAGIVWNPPTSCAWAARVLVNSSDACVHGRKEIGLPSHVAGFSKRLTPILRRERGKSHGILNMVGMHSAVSNAKDRLEIQVREIEGFASRAFCCINLPNSEPQSKPDTKHSWPVIRMSLPSFSGQTAYSPQLLKYSCKIECRVQAVKPAKVSRLDTASIDNEKGSCLVRESAEDDGLERSLSVLLSKPILALQFQSLTMQVEAPTIVIPQMKTAGSF